MSRYLRLAEYILARGWVMPIDLETYLLQEGVDISRLA